MWFNVMKPRETPLGFLPVVGEDWPVDDWKYADVHHVYSRTSDLVRRIIDTTPLTGGYKRILIDVKVQDLTPSIWSCVPGWHLDGAFPELGKVMDQHHLCVLNGPQTEFIAGPIKLETTGRLLDNMLDLIKMIPEDVPVTAVREGFITSFTSRDFHRGVKAVAPTRRLLVRLTETNTINAHNKPKAPSQGARK